jgi:hypothetical protein
MISNRKILGGVLLLAGFGVASCRAQPPVPPPPAAVLPPPPRRGPVPPEARGFDGSRTTISGVVRNFNYGPGGLDGLILDRGTVIHIPPEYANQASSIAPIGSSVSASGWSHIGPAGDTHFDADSITNKRTRASLNIAADRSPAPPGPPAPPPPPGRYGPPPPPLAPANYAAPAGPVAPALSGPASQASATAGTVRSFNYGPDGQLNGLILTDGTVAYFPPEFASQVTSMVSLNGRVTITGWPRVGATGNRLVDAEAITNRRTGVSVTTSSRLPLPPDR